MFLSLEIIEYKLNLLDFKVFNDMLPVTLNSYFNVEHSTYGMSSTKNFPEAVCKSNIRSLNIISITLRLWNTLYKQIKVTLAYIPLAFIILIYCFC